MKLVLRPERKAREMLRETELAKGSKGNQYTGKLDQSHDVTGPSLSDLGIKKHERLAGEMLKEMPKQKPGEYQRSHDGSVAPKLKDLGIKKHERLAGEMLRETDISAGRPVKNSNSVLPLTKLSDLGIKKHESSRWTSIAEIPDETFEELNKGQIKQGPWLHDVTSGTKLSDLGIGT